MLKAADQYTRGDYVMMMHQCQGMPTEGESSHCEAFVVGLL